MRLTQDDEMVQTLAPDRSDQPFGKAILPRRGWCNGLARSLTGSFRSCQQGDLGLVHRPRSLVCHHSLLREQWIVFWRKQRHLHLLNVHMRLASCNRGNP